MTIHLLNRRRAGLSAKHRATAFRVASKELVSRPLGKRTATASIAAALGVALTLGAAGTFLHVASAADRSQFTKATASSSTSTSTVVLTADEQAAWRAATSTSAGRQKVLTELRNAFSSVGAQLGVTPASSTGVVDAVYNGHSVEPVWSDGVTGDHFWIIASYNDVLDGSIAGLAAYCIGYGVPTWLCTSAAALITHWAAGEPRYTNHGVWVAVYWWPPGITGGRY